MGKPLHCWETSPEGGATCLLPIGHDRDHEFTPNGKIRVRLFTDFMSEMNERGE